MSKMLARHINLDGATLEDDGLGNLRQVPGTDGSGGGGSVDFFEESIPFGPTFALKYITLTYVPADFDSVELYIGNTSNQINSLRQVRGRHFTIVRNTVGGVYKRIVYDSTATPNAGNAGTIPDNDTAPTDGMQSEVLNTDYALVRYVK